MLDNKLYGRPRPHAPIYLEYCNLYPFQGTRLDELCEFMGRWKGKPSGYLYAHMRSKAFFMVTPPFWPHFAKDALARMGNIGFGPYDVACAALLSPPPGSENKKSYWMCRTVQIVKAYCLGLPVAWPKKRQPLCQEEDVEYAYQRDFLLGLELLSKYLPFLSHVWGVNYRLVPSTLGYQDRYLERYKLKQRLSDEPLWITLKELKELPVIPEKYLESPQILRYLGASPLATLNKFTEAAKPYKELIHDT